MYVKNGRITKTASQPMQTSYGEKQVLTVTTEDGNEEKIWFKPGRQPHSTMPMGAAVQVLYEQNRYGTMSKKLLTDIENGGQQQLPNSPSQQHTQHYQQQQYNAPKKKEVSEEEITEYVFKQASLLGTCVTAVTNMIEFGKKAAELGQQAAEELADEKFPQNEKQKFYSEITSEDIRAMAISLLIQAQRKFNL